MNHISVPRGQGLQAVALKVAGDKAMFFRVNILGSQDTLLDLSGSHYFYQCYIQGAVDFIFGSARSLYQDCILHSTAGSAEAIAAHHRNSADENSGFSFVNCKVNGTDSIYLGRAWGKYSRSIYSYCDFDNIIALDGWSDWGDASRRSIIAPDGWSDWGDASRRRCNHALYLDSVTALKKRMSPTIKPSPAFIDEPRVKEIVTYVVDERYNTLVSRGITKLSHALINGQRGKKPCPRRKEIMTHSE